MQKLIPWVAALIVVSAVFATIYGVIQQLDRLSANDTPDRVASQIASELNGGATPDLGTRVDLTTSLAPWVVIQDATGRATSGTAYLGDALVSLPTGVLATAGREGRDAVTWQPRAGLRFATVTLRAGNQLVTAGQSLAPSENRLGIWTALVGGGWAGSMVLIGAAWTLEWWLHRRPAPPSVRRPTSPTT